MILHFMKCDVCDKTHRFEPMMGPAWSQMPHDWLALFTGARDEEGYLFCSTVCLKKHLGVGEPTQSLEQPQTKMRRFLLVDEEAEEIEGILWGHGQVSLNGSSAHVRNFHCQANFLNWDDFKIAHPGCGVTWIDQADIPAYGWNGEVSSEAVR